MAQEPIGFDPYVVVLIALQERRDQIDQTINAIEAVRSWHSRTARHPADGKENEK